MATATPAGPMDTAARNKMAMINGLVLGLIYIVIVTLTNQAATAPFLYSLLKFTGYIIYLVILGFMLVNVRKANGGYLELREAFGAAFVTLLVAGAISFIYGNLYVYIIDPGFNDRVMNATVEIMEKKKVPEATIEDTIKVFEDSKKFSLNKTVVGFFSGLLVDCLFGLIVSLIVKKARPMFEPM